MARLPRLSLAHWPHLLVQRVHDGQLLARDDVDRVALLDALRDATRQHGVAVHAYCLAADHLHLLVTPSTDQGLSLCMQALGRRYVAQTNRRHKRQGGLWSGRYRATVLDAARYLLSSMVFIEQHAVRAGAVQHSDEDAWSSARHHLGLRVDPLVSDHPGFWALGNTPFEREAAWRQQLNAGLSASDLALLGEAAHKGWALVEPDALPGLQAASGRRMAPKPRGRPPKAAPVEVSLPQDTE
jgi:putative transposase